MDIERTRSGCFSDRPFEPVIRLLGTLLLIGLLQGCGNASDNDPDGDGIDNPYGLESRPTLANLNLPVTSPTGDITLEEAFPDLPSFNSPVFMTHSGDGSNRLFVVEVAGIIKVFGNDPAVSATTDFLDITDRVGSGGEMGLLGLAFDPDYTSNGYFYLYYTADSPARSVLARFQVTSNPNQADPGSETILLEVNQPFSNHNGGTILFGPDGMLYWGLGDGGSAGDPDRNGQNTETLLGSLMRIDPHGGTPYGIPADNPFTASDDGIANEIWAYGLRNPYRFSFDRDTGKLWLADVGQNEIEEIDVIEKGGNYGWNWYEGNAVYRSGAPSIDFKFPVYQYDHSLGKSITGGYVYRGSRIPSLQGKYVYADYVTSRVWALSVDGDLHAVDNTLLDTAPQNVSSFGEDETGELYVIGYRGKIYSFARGGGEDPLTGFPQQLSATGLFSDTATLTPADGLIEYSVQAPLWSDYAGKTRWIALPNSKKITFNDSTNWEFPVGTVLVKHFAMEMVAGEPGSSRRLETRVLIKQTGHWTGVTYRWNPQQTDAVLQTASSTETLVIADANFPGNVRNQTYFYPGPGDCFTCHTLAAGRVLGVRTLQLNSPFDYSGVVDTQIRAWNHIGLFSHNIGKAASYGAHAALDDIEASAEARSRSYLDANCSFCHQPGGPTPVNMDLTSTVALANAGLLNVTPSAGDLGIANARLIAPGDHNSSLVWQRMHVTDSNRMPPLGSSLPDETALSVIGEWIDGL